MKLSREVLIYFAKIIEKEIGVRYKDDLNLLETRLCNVADTYGFASVTAYYEEVLQNGMSQQMRDTIWDIATNNETSFFRDRHIFQNIKNCILQSKLYTKAFPPGFKVWSAACSTGQEAYSMAIICHEWQNLGLNRYFEIYATDISSAALKIANEACYSKQEIEKGFSSEFLYPWFVSSIKKEGCFYEPKYELRNNIHFFRQNLLEPWANKGPFDLVLLRNVLIYFHKKVQQRLVSQCFQCLNPGGYLVLGASESLSGIESDFKAVKWDESIVYVKQTAK